jgi:hypothetical protein
VESYVLTRSIHGGYREGLASAMGTSVGGLIHVAAAALGLSALLATSAVALAVVKYAGAAYLIYLGIQPCGIFDSRHPSLLGQHVFYQGVATEVFPGIHSPVCDGQWSGHPPIHGAGLSLSRLEHAGGCRGDCLSRSPRPVAGPPGAIPAAAAAGLRLDVDWVGYLCGDRSNSRIGLVLSAELFPIAPDTELVSVWPRHPLQSVAAAQWTHGGQRRAGCCRTALNL